MRALVVGGGIAGLAAAWELTRTGSQRGVEQVTVVESSPKVGGKLASTVVGEATVDSGPDCFLAREPAAAALCTELGLELAPPAVPGAFVWTRGRLRRLPEGLALGLPTRVLPLWRSGIVSPPGLARAGLDLVLPAGRPVGDVSVGQAVRSRFGREVAERLVDPLLGGIHAGSVDELSLQEVAPQIAESLREHRSALLALRGATRGKARGKAQGTSPATASTAPTFLAPTTGMHSLAGVLGDRLAAQGARIRTETAVQTLTRGAGIWTARLADGTRIDADGVVLATPAPVSAELLAAELPPLARELLSVAYASVVVLTLSYPPGAIPLDLPGTGFLSPRCEGRLMTACTWLSTKWERYRRGYGCLVRVSVGRAGDERHATMDDEELVGRCDRELREAMGTLAVPLPPLNEGTVSRWPAAIPQYRVGHRVLVEGIEKCAGDVPDLALAGSYLHGVGVPASMESGAAAARSLLS